MVSTGNVSIQAEPGSAKSSNGKDQIPLYNISKSRRGLLIDSIGSEVQQDPSRQCLRIPFVVRLNWIFVKNFCKEWIRNPMNMALFVWIACVAISGAILFLVMIGMLNHALPRKSQRDAWFEVNIQIINALFALMCLYQHPKRFYHLVLLWRWRSDDVLELRKIYCKNGTYKPHEWTHMMVVITLLHVNYFAQYALCGLYWGYKRSKRPAIGVGLCVAVTIVSAAIGGIYCILSPLGKESESELDPVDQEAQITTIKPDQIDVAKPSEKRYSFVSKGEQRVMESNPEWRGGLFDLWDDISVACLSMFCSFCIFGWNVEKLGFGNMYVHIATFLLLCMAPFWIFNLAAINIDNEVVREALGITGIVLCAFGLFYGGFWRTQMRKRFRLPANNFCCRSPAVTDCMQWLFCCPCSLAQEVRTGDFYEIEEDRVYRKQTNGEIQAILSPIPIPLEEGSPQFKSNPSSPLQSHSSPSASLQIPSRLAKGSGMLEELPIQVMKVDSMTPPVPLSIQRREENRPKSF